MALTKEKLKALFAGYHNVNENTVREFIDYLFSYERYTVLFNQFLDNAPTAIIRQNTLRGEIVWTYESPGKYIGTLVGAFPENKMWVDVSRNSNDVEGDDYKVQVRIYRVDNDTIKMETGFEGDFQDTGLQELPVEIRIYN